MTCFNRYVFPIILGLSLFSLGVQSQCPICGDGVELPFPNREIFVAESDVFTCQDLENQAAADPDVCADAPNFAFYCGCPGKVPDCPLCANELVGKRFRDRELKGFEPDWWPAGYKYTCEIVERELSLVQSGDECEAASEEIKDLARYCGCFLPSDHNCSSLCSDGSFIDPRFWDMETVVDQPGMGTLTCGQYQRAATSGQLADWQCWNANYIGTKLCGCQENREYCDLCEDGSVPSNLAQEVTYLNTCLDHAGAAYDEDALSDYCPAYQKSYAQYCGCPNPEASKDACRVCSEPGGQVVKDWNFTVYINGMQRWIDCGELEFGGNVKGGRFDCNTVKAIGQPLCCNDTVAPFPGSPPGPPRQPRTAFPTQAPVEATKKPKEEAGTDAPTAGSTAESTSQPTAESTSQPTAGETQESTGEVATSAPTAEGTAESTAEATTATTPVSTIEAATSAPTAESTAESTAEATSATTPVSTIASPPLESCTICGDGESLPDPTREIIIEGEEIVTCAQLEAAAAVDDTLCPSLASFSFYCGCPIQGEFCPFCTGGGLSPTPELHLKGYEPAWFPTTRNFTCQDAERIHSVKSGASCLPEDEEIGLLCGCIAPADANCTSICPDGTLVDESFLSVVIAENYPLVGTLTCGNYQLAAATGRMEMSDCDAANYAGVKKCGCKETISYCDMCEDGSAAPLLEWEITYGRTCLDHAGDGYFASPEDEMCGVYQATFGEYCGCNNPVASNDTCRICDVRGGFPVPDPNFTILVDSEFLDCGSLEFAANDPSSNLTCEEAVQLGEECCSVTRSPTAAPLPSCSICGTSNLPDPDREIILQGKNITTCGQLEQEANSGQVQCADLSQYQTYCGCSVTSGDCLLCPNGRPSPKPDLVLKGYEPTWFPKDKDFTCAVAAGILSFDTDVQCAGVAIETEIISNLCGCFVSQSSSNCSSLCPGGTLVDPTFENVKVFDNDPNVGTVTCAEYQLTASRGDLGVAECDAAHYVGVKVCGCNSTRPFCDLCEDGTVVPNLGKEITFGKTCLDHAADGYFTDAESEICPALQASYGMYCGCNNTNASQDACRICDRRGGAPVFDSNQTVKVGEFIVECGNLEFTGNDPRASFSCEHVTAFGPGCCGENPVTIRETSPPTEESAPAPTLGPRPESSPAPTETSSGEETAAPGESFSLSRPSSAHGWNVHCAFLSVGTALVGYLLSIV